MSSERRLYPRIHTDLPGELELLDDTHDVRVINLSLAGLLVEGGAELVNLSAPMNTGTLEVNLHFGIDDQPLHCHCRVVYKRRFSYDRIGLGLHILSLNGSAQDAIQGFVDAQLMAD